MVSVVAGFCRENAAFDSLMAASSSAVHSRNVISSRGTNSTWPMGMLWVAEIPSPGWSTYRNSLSCANQSVSTLMTSIGATGRSIMLRIDV